MVGTATENGKIVQVIGPVVDIEVPTREASQYF